MEKSDQKVGKIFLVFIGICIISVPFIVFSAFSSEQKAKETPIIETTSLDFDQNGKLNYENYDQISEEYLKNVSPERTLREYYSRRQYIGSPPFIPHKMEDADGDKMACLTCHAKGGFTEELKRHTPLTPHPEHTNCQQCHVPMVSDKLFVGLDWESVLPPRLGRSHLPGSPPPVPHTLQMRGNCIPCHVGPGAVNTIRVEHPSRGNCRQCHVPDDYGGLFER